MPQIRKLLDKYNLDNYKYIISDAARAVITGLLIIPLYAGNLSLGDYGLVSYYKSLIELLIIMFSVGLPSVYVRQYFEFNEDNQTYTNSIINFIFLIFSLIGLAYIVILYLPLEISQSQNMKIITPIILFTAMLSVLESIVSVCLRAREMVNLFVIFNIVRAGLIFLLGFIFLKLNMEVLGVLISLLLAALISFPYLWYLVKSSYKLEINFSYLLNALKFSWPIFIGLLGIYFINKSGIILIENSGSMDDLGRYALAQNFSLIVVLIAGAYSKYIQPIIFKSKKNKFDQLFSIHLIEFSYRLFATTILLVFFKLEILSMIVPDSFNEAGEYITYLVLGSYIYSFVLMINMVLMYHKNSKGILFSTLTGAVVTWITMYILMQPFGVMGAVYGTIFGQLITVFIFLAISDSFIKINIVKYILLNISYTFIISFISMFENINFQIKVIIFLGIIICSKYFINYSKFAFNSNQTSVSA